MEGTGHELFSYSQHCRTLFQQPTTVHRGRYLKRYNVIAITLRYVFALSYNALTLWRNVIASISYRSEHIRDVIASYSYRSKLIDQRYRPY